MVCWADLKILYHLTLKPLRGRNHAERMESFYAGQAEGYDAFRQRLLTGREQLLRALPLHEDDVWVDLGAGTGSNLEHVAERIPQLQRVDLVDLSPSLLEVAHRRCQRHGWKHVRICQADAATYRPPQPVDVVTFSYSLTMIPDWFAALDNARQMLRPSGHIGVVDFYVARKYPAADRVRHGWFTRQFWPLWFSLDNVFPSRDHLPYLQRHFRICRLEEGRASIPYVPWIRAPYYLFVGRPAVLPEYSPLPWPERATSKLTLRVGQGSS